MLIKFYRREHNRQIAALTEWSTVLTTERGLWAKADAIPRWRLDETEGPYRVRFVYARYIHDRCLTERRKKLEPDAEKMPSSKVDQQQIGDVESFDVDTQSIMQIEVPPWSESYELSSAEVDGEPARTLVHYGADLVPYRARRRGR